MHRHIAVIDIGKTNAKLVLFDMSARREIATLTTANTVLPAPPYPHYDLDRLSAFILDGLGQLQARHGIDAVSITTHGATAVLMAGDELALPVLDYEYDGPQAWRSQYDIVRGAFTETLSPALPVGLNLGAQLFFQQKTQAEAFARVTDILFYPQYWAYRLTGLKAGERTSLGVHTDLWAPDKNDYAALVDRMNWRALFPPLLPTRSVLGPVSAAIAAETGLSPETDVAVGIHDSNASLLPHLLSVTEPLSVVSSGTWTILMSPGAPTGGLDADRDCLANIDAFGRPVPTARFMGGREFEILMGDGPFSPPEEKDIDHVLSHDIMVLPSFAGEVGPFPHKKGAWINGPAGLSPAQKLVAVSLYLALMTRTGFTLSGMGEDIVVEGPLARNKLYAKALAGLTGKRVHLSTDATGTSFGAALLFEDTTFDPPLVPEPVTALTHPGLATYAARWQDRTLA